MASHPVERASTLDKLEHPFYSTGMNERCPACQERRAYVARYKWRQLLLWLLIAYTLGVLSGPAIDAITALFNFNG